MIKNLCSLKKNEFQQTQFVILTNEKHIVMPKKSQKLSLKIYITQTYKRYFLKVQQKLAVLSKIHVISVITSQENYPRYSL